MPVRKKGEVLFNFSLWGVYMGGDLGSYRGTFAYFDYPEFRAMSFQRK